MRPVTTFGSPSKAFHCACRIDTHPREPARHNVGSPRVRLPRASCTPPDRRERRGASGDLCLSRLHRLTDHSLVGWPRPGPPYPPGVFTAQHSLRCVCQPPSGPRGRREKLIWSLAQECKSLPAKRLEIKLDQGAHRLGMPYPRGLMRGESQGHRSTNAESQGQVSDLRPQGASSWYFATCISRGVVTGPGKGSALGIPRNVSRLASSPRHVLQGYALSAVAPRGLLGRPGCNALP